MTIETAPVAATVPTANQDDAEVIHIPEIVGYLKSIGDQCPGPGAIVTGNELLNKLGSGDSLSDVDKINVREIAKDERSKYMSQYLRFSYIVYWVERKDLWREWGYDSFDDYFELELGLSSSSKSRYLRAFPVYCKLRQFAQVSVAEAKVPSLSSLEELAGLFGRINRLDVSPTKEESQRKLQSFLADVFTSGIGRRKIREQIPTLFPVLRRSPQLELPSADDTQGKNPSDQDKDDTIYDNEAENGAIEPDKDEQIDPKLDEEIEKKESIVEAFEELQVKVEAATKSLVALKNKVSAFDSRCQELNCHIQTAQGMARVKGKCPELDHTITSIEELEPAVSEIRGYFRQVKSGKNSKADESADQKE